MYGGEVGGERVTIVCWDSARIRGQSIRRRPAASACTHANNAPNADHIASKVLHYDGSRRSLSLKGRVVSIRREDLCFYYYFICGRVVMSAE
jgi:hypothetical protein